jgi:predicted dehydrogenase
MASAGGRLLFDVAVPARHLLEVLPQLPDGSAVLMQKPMGETLAEAESILALCRRKHLVAAVNFQLRWSPAMLAARALYQRGALGTLHDIEVQVRRTLLDLSLHCAAAGNSLPQHFFRLHG